MKEIRVDDIVQLQESCNKLDMPNWIKYEMNYLCNVVIKKANDNNGLLDGIQLYFPDDYKNYDLFLRFAKLFKCSFGVVSAKWNRYVIYDIGQGYSYVILDKSMRKSIEEADSRYGKKGRRK